MIISTEEIMKKSVSLILTAVFLILLCSCSAEQNNPSSSASVLPKGRGLKITAFGDSIAAGYGLESQDDNYLTLFSKNIGAVLTNDAVSGYDSDDLVSLISSGKADGDIKNADIIILSIGGNDILHNSDEIISVIKQAALHGGEYFPESINGIYLNFEKNLTAVFTHIQSVNPNASVIIQTLYNPALKQGYKISVIDASKLIDKYIVRLNESIFSVSGQFESVTVFDVADEMNKDADNFYNLKDNFDIHPTKNGHLTLSELYTKYYNNY